MVGVIDEMQFIENGGKVDNDDENNFQLRSVNLLKDKDKELSFFLIDEENDRVVVNDNEIFNDFFVFVFFEQLIGVFLIFLLEFGIDVFVEEDVLDILRFFLCEIVS